MCNVLNVRLKACEDMHANIHINGRLLAGRSLHGYKFT